jgi:magnesium transporter
MDDPPVVPSNEARDRAAWQVVQSAESEAVVVHADGTLAGIVPAPRMLALLVREHEDDLARLSGYLHQGDSARSASNESVMRRFAHRLPWLALGLIGAFGASGLVSGFEDQLAKVVSLAFFIPAVVYLADAVGTQTEAIAVRGLSVGVGIGNILLREIATGLLLGVVLGAAFLGPAYLLAHDWNVALAVGLALCAACACANVIALVVPWCFAKVGVDPAFGAGPLATVVQDLVSILLYFAIAVQVVPEL